MLTASSEILSLKSFKAYYNPTKNHVEIHFPIHEAAAQQFGDTLIKDSETASTGDATGIGTWEQQDISQQQIRQKRTSIKNGEQTRIASNDLPLRSASGGAVERLDDDFIVLLRKDSGSPRDPYCFVSSNGYPQSFHELFHPRRTIEREASEELVYVRTSDNTLMRPMSERISYYRQTNDWLGCTAMDRFIFSYDQDLFRDEIILYDGEGNELSREYGVFNWQPERSGCDVLRVRQVPFAFEDIANGTYSIHDGEGDPEGWNRDIYFLPEHELAAAYRNGGSVHGHKSVRKDEDRSLTETSVTIDKDKIHSYHHTGDTSLARNTFIPSQPLHSLLEHLAEVK